MIAFDAVANDLESSATPTWSHTTSGSNRILHAGVRVSAGISVTGVTYNGVAMTNVPTNSPVTTPGGELLYVFYLINPTTGTHDIIATLSGSDTVRSVSISHTGVKQSGQPNASGNGTASGESSITDSITATVSNCWVVAFTSNTVDVAADGINYVHRDDSAGVGVGDTNASVSGLVSQTVNTSGSADWGIIQVAIAPVPESTGSAILHFI